MLNQIKKSKYKKQNTKAKNEQKSFKKYTNTFNINYYGTQSNLSVQGRGYAFTI